MKKIGFCLLILTVMASLFSISPVTAQPAGNWQSTVSCQNQDMDNPALVNLVFYETGTGDIAHSFPDDIPAGKSTTYMPADLAALGSNFFGSLVIESSSPISCAAEHNKVATGSMADPYRFAASKGFTAEEAAPIVYVSQVQTDFYGWDSYMGIQNTSSTEVDVTVTYVDRWGNTYPTATETLTIPGYGNHVVYLDQNNNLPSQFIGGATVKSDDGITPLAVVATLYNTGADHRQSQVHAYNGAGTGANTLYAPYVVRNYYGYQSGLMVQNVGDSPTSFRVTFTFAGQDYVYQHPTTLRPGEVKDLYLPDVTELAPVDGLNMPSRFGKAVIQATDTNGSPNVAGMLSGNVNQDNRGGPGIPEERAGQGSTYGAFLATGGSQNIFLPRFMNSVGGIFTSGYNISNFSGGPGKCDIKFVNHAAANYSVNIATNAFHSIWGADVEDLQNGYDGGVVIQCTMDVFVIMNASANPGSGRYGDSFYQMNAGTE